jgi:hypothetical protein
VSDTNDDGIRKGSPLSGKDTLDQVILHCLRHSICTSPKTVKALGEKNVVRVGNIAFSAYSHDTGADVRGWIIDGDDAFEFMSVPYWYSSQYTFNTSKHVRGAWDAAVDAAILELRRLKAESEERFAQAERDRDNGKRAEAAAIKARFEHQFKTA